MCSDDEMTDATRLNDDPIGSIERRDGAVIVRITDELHLCNAPQIRSTLLALIAEDPDRMIVDLGEVDFIDSTVLGALFEVRGKLGNGRAFLFAAPGRETHRAPQISA